MGGEVKTNVSDDFKSLEVEMGLRQEGDTALPTTKTYLFAVADHRQAWNVCRNP